MTEDPKEKKTEEQNTPVEEPTPSEEQTNQKQPEESEKATPAPADKPTEPEPQEPKEDSIPEAQPKEETKAEKPAEKQEAAPKKNKKQKKKKEEKKADKEEIDEDFNYIVRIANTDIDGNLTAIYGISQIKGVGHHLAILIADHSGIPKHKKMGKLSPEEVKKIQETLDEISNIAPSWMLNHRKDMETGEDIHLISTEIDLKLRDELNLLKMIRCYRGIRHENRLPVRGQRTRANNRTGLTLGVSKKK